MHEEKVKNPPAGAMQDKDPWKHRSEGMRCRTCIYFVPKAPVHDFGRCRRHAPSMNGYPAVFSKDWCGDHKLDEGKLHLNDLL